MTRIPDLVVGRDRAHVKSLLVDYPHAEVISASSFFDRVRYLAFLNDEKLKRDDHAPMIFAHHLLIDHQRYSTRMAKQFSSLFSACYHGTSTPEEVLAAAARENVDFLPIIKIVAEIDHAMKQHSLVNGVSALFSAWNVIRLKKIIPMNLARTRLISLWHLVDLTLLEIEVIKDLSRLGLQFDIHFPMDFYKRGINAAVDFSAKQFERDDNLINIDLSFDNIAKPGPIAPLVEHLFTEDQSLTMAHEHCSINLAADVTSESEQLAVKVAEILTASPGDEIAIVVRSIDQRSLIYKRALIRHGLSVRDRKGLPLLETRAGVLLLTLVSSRLWSLAKKDLSGLINHPGFFLHVSDDQTRGRIFQLIFALGIDDRIIPMSCPWERYREKLYRYRSSLLPDSEGHQDLQTFEDWLTKVIDMLMTLPHQATFHHHLQALLLVMERAFTSDEPSVVALKEAIRGILSSASAIKNDKAVSFRDFFLVLKSELASITIPRPDNEDLNAVEFLLLPELLGRSFDHVFIVDISFGRLPQNASPDPLLDDQARIALNQIMKKPLLRVFFDDPYEPLPVPPRQALEPFWFASAIASAKSSVHFFCASCDEGGQEQAPSEFFMWLVNHINVDVTGRISARHLASREYRRLLEGIAHQQSESPITNDYHKAWLSRKAAFYEGKAAPFAFSFNQEALRQSFNGRLFDPPTHALTPTMVEAFSSCRFKGLAERILGMGNREAESDDMDARSLGQIAHRVLELFFFKPELEADLHRQRLKAILDEVSKDFLARNFIASSLVFVCHMEWLHEALVSLVEVMSESAEFDQQANLALELAFGVGDSSWPPLKITTSGRTYLLGGRVDRILKSHDRFLVVDYKLSKSQSLKASLSDKQLLATNFQVPIYLRVVAEHLAGGDAKKVSFLFASIRDSELISANSLNNRGSLARIFDDEGEDGLAKSIDRIFAPIIKGEVLATPGEHCSRCDFIFFCRKTESQNHG